MEPERAKLRESIDENRGKGATFWIVTTAKHAERLPSAGRSSPSASLVSADVDRAGSCGAADDDDRGDGVVAPDPRIIGDPSGVADVGLVARRFEELDHANPSRPREIRGDGRAGPSWRPGPRVRRSWRYRVDVATRGCSTSPSGGILRSANWRCACEQAGVEERDRVGDALGRGLLGQHACLARRSVLIAGAHQLAVRCSPCIRTWPAWPAARTTHVEPRAS